jgi:hypothetical protein
VGKRGELTSSAAIVTTLWGEGISLSMLRYLSTSDNDCFRRLASSEVWSLLTSVGNSSPRSGGTVETLAHAKADIIVLI